MLNFIMLSNVFCFFLSLQICLLLSCVEVCRIEILSLILLVVIHLFIKCILKLYFSVKFGNTFLMRNLNYLGLTSLSPSLYLLVFTPFIWCCDINFLLQNSDLFFIYNIFSDFEFNCVPI